MVLNDLQDPVNNTNANKIHNAMDYDQTVAEPEVSLQNPMETSR